MMKLDGGPVLDPETGGVIFFINNDEIKLRCFVSQEYLQDINSTRRMDSQIVQFNDNMAKIINSAYEKYLKDVGRLDSEYEQKKKEIQMNIRISISDL